MNEILEMYLNLDMKNEQEKEELLRRIDTLTNTCSIDEIRTDRMSDPSPEKMWYYEQYYQKTNSLALAIYPIFWRKNRIYVQIFVKWYPGSR